MEPIYNQPATKTEEQFLQGIKDFAEKMTCNGRLDPICKPGQGMRVLYQEYVHVK